MDRGKVKPGWMVGRKVRQATFLKRRANLFKKASELSKQCDVPVAVLVYFPGEDEPTTWPPAPAEAAAILQRYANLVDSAQDDLNVEGFYRQSIKKLRKEVDIMKLANRAREVFLVLDDLFYWGHQILDDLSDDLAADVMAVVQLRKKVLSDRIKSLMAASQELPMVADPPAAAVAGVDVSTPVDMDGGELPHGSYLLKKVAAVIKEGSGNGVEPTAADMERFLRELVLFY